jgi:hypothetical protein
MALQNNEVAAWSTKMRYLSKENKSKSLRLLIDVGNHVMGWK